MRQYIIYGPFNGMIMWRGKASSPSDATRRAIDAGCDPSKIVSILVKLNK